MSEQTQSTQTSKSIVESPESVIDTSSMNEGKRAALELAESSRESHWEYPTFAGEKPELVRV